MGSKNILLTDTSSWFLQFVKITGLPTHLTTLLLLGDTGLLEEDSLCVPAFEHCNTIQCNEWQGENLRRNGDLKRYTRIYAYGNIKGVIFNLIIPGKIFHRNNNLVYCAFSPHKLSRWMGTNFSHCSKRSQPSTQARLLCCMQRKHVGQLSTQVYFPMHRSLLS